MKTLLSLALLCFFGTMAADAPDESFEILMDAFYAGDASVVEAHLSAEALQMIEMMLVMVKMQPDQAAAEISQELQIALTGEELMNWTAIEFIDALINSPGIREEMPAREDIQVSGCDVDGDTGTVYLTVLDYPERFEIEMIRENDGWKLAENLISSEL